MNLFQWLWVCFSVTSSAMPSIVYWLYLQSGFLLDGKIHISSVAQLCPTLRIHGLQHARLSCPSPTPGAYSNSCPSSRWCHPTISSSVIPFSSCLQSFPASGSFLMSQLFTSGGQSIGVSASASVLQWIFRTDFLQDGLVGSPCSPRDSQESSPTPQFKSIKSDT